MSLFVQIRVFNLNGCSLNTGSVLVLFALVISTTCSFFGGLNSLSAFWFTRCYRVPLSVDVAARYRTCIRLTRRRRSARRCGSWIDRRTGRSRQMGLRSPCLTCSYSAVVISCTSFWRWVQSATPSETDCASSRHSSTAVQSTGSSRGPPTRFR